MNIKVTKITDVELLRKANSFTTGKESRQSLKSAYRCKHSTIRTQLFYVECYKIPQFVAYHLRTHFSLYPMPPFEYPHMKSKRKDKGGCDFRDECDALVDTLEMQVENIEDIRFPYMRDVAVGNIRDAVETIKILPQMYDRHAPTDFGFMISAEGLMNLAEKRLCIGAVSKETREVVEAICQLVEECDPDLYPHLVKPCVACGVCREAKCCGYIHSDMYRESRNRYKSLFRQ